jgi:FixJ family two-component response regulator
MLANRVLFSLGEKVPLANKPKPSAQETQERRMLVFRMKMRGLTHASIARELDVNPKTITRDAKWIKEHMREVAASVDKYEELGEAMASLQEISKEAMYQFNETEKASEKNSFLVTALNATNQRIKMMMEAGIIDKAATDVNLSLDLSKLTTDELEKKRAEVMSRLATQPGGLSSVN